MNPSHLKLVICVDTVVKSSFGKHYLSPGDRGLGQVSIKLVCKELIFAMLKGQELFFARLMTSRRLFFTKQKMGQELFFGKKKKGRKVFSRRK